MLCSPFPVFLESRFYCGPTAQLPGTPSSAVFSFSLHTTETWLSSSCTLLSCLSALAHSFYSGFQEGLHILLKVKVLEGLPDFPEGSHFTDSTHLVEYFLSFFTSPTGLSASLGSNLYSQYTCHSASIHFLFHKIWADHLKSLFVYTNPRPFHPVTVHLGPLAFPCHL